LFIGQAIGELDIHGMLNQFRFPSVIKHS
jgi:hypothetical protein